MAWGPPDAEAGGQPEGTCSPQQRCGDSGLGAALPPNQPSPPLPDGPRPLRTQPRPLTQGRLPPELPPTHPDPAAQEAGFSRDSGTVPRKTRYVTLGQAGQVAARCLCLSVSGLRNGESRVSAALRPHEALRDRALRKTCGGNPDGRSIGSAASAARCRGSPPLGPRACQAQRVPAASHGRRPAHRPGSVLQPLLPLRDARTSPPPAPNVATFLSLTETPGRAAGPEICRPSPGPRVRASVRARAALTASAMSLRCPARPGVAAAAAARTHAGRTPASPQASPARPAPPPGLARPSGPACLGREGRAGTERPSPAAASEQGARRYGRPGRLCPGRKLGPGPQHRPPARARPLCGRGCDPGSGLGPGCELRCRPGASSAGELHCSCHVDTNCILGGMSLSGRLKRNTPRLVGGFRNPDSSIYSR